MKTTFVRAVVLTLTFAGLTAPTISAKKVTPSKAIATSTNFSGYPMPLCLPSSGNVCGLD